MPRPLLAIAACVTLVSSLTRAAAAAPDGPIAAVPYQQVTIGGPFWSPRLAAIRTETLAANRRQCDITGRIANFENAARKIIGDKSNPPGEFQGLLFNDSDVYKMMEGWACVIATEADPARKRDLDADLDALIAKVAAAQHADGYIDTYYTLKAGLDKRFTREEWDHETYCMGHLIEAGVVHFEATGKAGLLAVAVKAADFLRRLYGPDTFTAPPGHQQLELALIKLARVTGNDRYAAFAHELVEYRGRPHRKLDGATYGPWGDYCQDHQPAARQHEAAGHAVRAGYLYCAMTDLAALGHGEYVLPLRDLWQDITQRRIFVTGGIGPSGRNEGFTVPYDIPTHSAYQETCASIALCLWAHRMFLLEGDAKYMEQFERTLYNAALAGVSLDGKEFFYVNPLASRGGHARQAWFGCACCPPNVLRFLSSLGQYVYAVRDSTVFVNLLLDSEATVQVGGKPVVIRQTTDYPFSGKVSIAISNATGASVTLAIRDPSAKPEQLDASGYRRVAVAPGRDQRIELNLPMDARRVYSDPRVKASLGRAAIMRGPLVYAAESIDNPGGIADVILPATASITQSVDAVGVPILTASGFRVMSADDQGETGEPHLYHAGPALQPAAITLRPYFMWANRGPSQMQVWLPETPQMLDPQPPRGVKFSASFTGHGDGLSAIADGVLPSASGDETIPRFTFWPHKGGEEWVACTFDAPRTVSRISVYWFDDTGHGECRVPDACAVEYLDGANWKPVPGASAGAVGVAKDAVNITTFQPVTTKGLRLVITQPEKMASGILEWGY